MKTILVISVLVSALGLNGQSITNAGFENLNDTLPTGWQVDPNGANISTDYSHTGNNAISVWTWYYYVNGWAVNGNFPGGFGGQYNFGDAGTPIDQKYDRLTGYYRYDTTGTYQSGKVEAYIGVLFKKYNSSKNEYDTVALGEGFLSPTEINDASFTPFTVAIIDLMPGISPDSVAICISSGDNVNPGCANFNGVCQYLYVDDLQFEKGTNIRKIDSWFENQVPYPNPTTGQFTLDLGQIRSDELEICIRNTIGKTIQTKRVKKTNSINLNIDGAPGLYFVEVRTEDGKSAVLKVVKE